MALTPKEKAAELLEKIIAKIDTKFSPPESQQIKRFVQYFYQVVVPEDMLEREDVSNLYGAAVAYWRFASQYTPEQTKVLVYNPQFEQDGWQSSHTVVSILIKDMPFLVDSIRMALNQHGLTVHFTIHPVLKTRRDEQGQLLEVLPYNGDAQDALAEMEMGNEESIIHLEVDRQTEAAVLDNIARELEKVLNDVSKAVDDWQAMREKMSDVLQELESSPPPLDAQEINEVCDFLRWAQSNHFIFLGYREYELSAHGDEIILYRVPGSGLGILRDQISNSQSSFAQLPLRLRKLALQPTLLLLNKTSAPATIHRPGHLDYIGIKRFNQEGVVTGEQRFLGLYTSAAYHQLTSDTPLIRRKIKSVFEKAGFRCTSHKKRALSYILETYPRDELFQIDEETLFQTTMGILQLQERQQRIRLFVRPDTFGRFFSCLVYVSRDRYETEIRQRIQKVLLEAFGGSNVKFSVWLSELVALTQIHFIIYTPTGSCPDYDIKDIEKRLIEVTLTWSKMLQEALLEHNGEEVGTRFFYSYENAFPVAYREEFSARHAVYDIEKIEAALKCAENCFSMSLYRPVKAFDNSLGFKLFHVQSHISLSEVLHKLENMGVKVISECSYQVQATGKPSVWIQDFGLQHQEKSLKISEVKGAFQDVFERVWRGEIENDGFNRLVLQAQLNWREIIIFRAYWKYLRQTGASFSLQYVEQALVNNPAIVKLLRDLFNASCNPALDNRSNHADALVQQIEKSLDSVASLDEDRILRRFLGVILATLRTNYFQVDAAKGNPKPYLSFKFDPSQVPELPEPRPMFEIFVYSPRVEGVHLRGGKVARGGLRWSDRIEDFRTEILGLVKAQMVKNTVIVPVGSKGGFIAKNLPSGGGRDAIQAEGIECYKTFIRGLLDLTDNLVDGQIVPPPDVVRHDEDDPYLVVAADKGTATFSDLANEIAQTYQFWLGDAFASGGSAGYDHKKIGITARGAWEAVKLHFRELDRHIQTQDFTVMGIGSMSGDVFGNGMLLSEHIKLVGAFNHSHILLDPNPNPQQSFQERQRLFQARSSWVDYDTRVISPGGGVFSRSRKSIALSPEVQALLDIQAYTLTPNELIRAMLCAPVDLLWNGGIGTYVKAQTEHQMDVGDKTNDALRVNGQDLRCKVVGEGGNLGFTQLGRIEYALKGGRIYTDAMDNAAGVDCSDHEVNIKILLDAIVTNGDMTHKQRNQLLAEMTEAVTHLVLKNSYLQMQSLSISHSISPQLLDLHGRFIRHLERQGQLDRALEFLPSHKVLAERQVVQQGLTAPELCVLQAYSKITLYKTLLESDLLEEPYFKTNLENYFSAPLPERFAAPIALHRLRREIIATKLTNLVVNYSGIVFVFGLDEETGQTAADIVRAFMVSWKIFDMQSIFAEIEALDDQISAIVQIRMMIAARQQIERASRWLLRHYKMPLEIANSINTLRPGVLQLADSLSSLMSHADQEQLEMNAQQFIDAGVSKAFATRVASLVYLLSALDIVEVANTTSVKLEKVAAVHFLLGTRLKLHWLRAHIGKLPRDTRWTALSRSALRDELYRTHRQLTTVVLQNDDNDIAPDALLSKWMETKSIERCQNVLSDLSCIKKPDLSMLSVALREIRNLL
ncbi:MAG: NAD-glutamate dehydrogenase [Gammaproteobacteria bacterium]|nr:MAG: NAD-glutamate dehydrogenase [Gammaproteobacteria bacterium]